MNTEVSPPSLLDSIRQAVESSSLTKVELAKMSGMSRKTLFSILEGTGDFKVSSLLALADALELDVLLVPKMAREARLGEAAAKGHSPHSRVGAFLRSFKN